ncbi:host cell division inhibitor Icd-like protein [Erwinia endophytica]|uniref:host cell division inhibitor Icd-like protein n=1 Tax=Erwinia endophytica TaxID=1563158 RepID=UPI001265E55D|nr:host cell division inhibitor Icd-like protein [Erwinia endophytica]KAB8311963.1 host cell division inhibitor Icd-like protein [Erwinia endophytica]
MADTQSTQTHPKFTWRFLAVPVAFPDAKPIVLHSNASSVTEARQNWPGWELFFAARLPVVDMLPAHLPERGDRYLERDSGMMLVIRERRAGRVVFSYEQYTLAIHDRPLQGFADGFQLLEVAHV